MAALATAVGLLTHCGPEDVPPREAAHQAALATSTGFAAAADARVEANYPTQNFGMAAFLGADTSPGIQTYLRFSVTSLSGTVTRAVVRLYVTDGTDNGPQLFTTAGGWSETGLTWNNKPAPGTALADAGALSANTYVEYDVTSQVRGNGEFNFVLVPQASNGADFAAQESGTDAQRPRLLVTTDTGTQLPPSECGESARVLTVAADADAYVLRDQPDARFGTTTSLVSDGDPVAYALLKFTVPSARTGEQLKSARLRVYAFDGTSDGPRVQTAGTDWEEATVTYNTAPWVDSLSLGDKGAIAANTWVEYDVTETVKERQRWPVGFALVPTSGDAARFYAREASDTSLRPQLVVTFSTDCAYRGAGGALGWSRQYGVAQAGEDVIDAATDKDGGLVVLSRATEGGANFGGTTLPSAGLVIARYDASGAHLWSRAYVPGTDPRVEPTAVAVTPEGNILVVGNYRGAPDFGLGPLPDAGVTTAVFAAKFAPSGRPVWNHGVRASFTSAGTREPRSLLANDVATDANGSLIVVGEGYGSADFGGGEVETGSSATEPNPGAFVAKYRWDGAYLWSLGVPDSMCGGGVVAQAVATDSQGRVLVGGHSCQNAWLGGTNAFTPFVARFTPEDGALSWVGHVRGVFGEVWDVAAGPGDGVYFAGEFRGRTTFAGREVTNANPDMGYDGTPDLMVGAWTADGAERWLRDLPDVMDEARASRLSVAPNGDVLVTGRVPAGADLGGGSLAKGAFVARYDASGTHRWSRTLANPYSNPSVCARPSGDAVVALGFYDPVRVGGTTFTTSGALDALFLQFAP